MISHIPSDAVYKNAPVIAFERDICDIWKITSVSTNNEKYGILVGVSDLLSHVHQEDQEIVTRKFGGALLQKRSEVELRYRILAGKCYRWVEEYCSLSYDAHGNLTKVSSFLWISSLPIDWALLYKGSEIWSALNSKIRHDILNQLTAILGYLELSSDFITDPMLLDFIHKEQSAAEKIRDRLIFTREYQKIGLLEFSWVFLSDIIKEALNEITMNSIQVEIHVGDCQIYVDKNFRLALEKILTNVPEHAVGATKVIVAIQQAENGSFLIIEDNGCGIEPHHKARIFDIGFGNGGGYGLFLAEKLLSVFGISVQENGVAGQGARFELHIPSHILKM